MRGTWPRLAARLPGLVVFILLVTTIHHADGYPWGLPILLVDTLAVAAAFALEHFTTHAINAYFGFDDEDDDDQGPDDDEDPDGPIIVPDTPEALFENAR